MAKGTVTFTCLTCETEPTFDATKGSGSLKAHLKDVHGIAEENPQGVRSFKMHMDGQKTFSDVYEWDIKGIKVNQTVTVRRRGLDADMWK